MVVAALAVAALLALPGAALAADLAAEQRLVASDGTNNDFFGDSVDVDGDTAVVGASSKESSRGAAYVFTRTEQSWTQVAKLTASDRAAGAGFGTSVAIDGDTIVVGANGASPGGAVYTFARTGAAARTETAKLTASDAASGKRLGQSVDIDGDTIVAGSPFDNGARGSVYTFTRTGDAFTQTAKLVASDAATSDQLGFSVRIQGDTIAVGAPGDDGNRGSAYTFASTGAAARTQTAKLIAADGAGFDFFGRTAIAIDGTTIIVGAPNATLNGNGSQGFASIFFRVVGDGVALTVAKPGQGQGTVTSSPEGINCGPDCTEDYLGGTRVTLTATPTDPETSTFAGFTGGGCSGTARTCTVTLDDAKTVTATFDQVKRPLTVSKTGAGQGTVTSSPAGIDCGSVCSADFPINSQVTVTATSDAGSRFAGFTGGGCSGTATTCTVTLDEAKTVTASFARIPVTPPPGPGPAPGPGPGSPTPGGGDDGDGVVRLRPNLLRPGPVRAVQRGRRIVVTLRGRMVGNRGRRCGGRIKIGTRAGARRARTQIARIGNDCRYAKKYSFPVRRLPPRLRPRGRTLVLRIKVRYQGNAQLRGDLSPTKRVKVRR
jgi:hypothetical protein